jgi:hypothetical protein
MSNRYRPTDFKLRSWLRSHRPALLALGLPLSVVNSERHWLLFLEDGTFSSVLGSPPDIDVERLPSRQAIELLEFLLAHYPERNDAGMSPLRAVNRLETILQRGPHAA